MIVSILIFLVIFGMLVVSHEFGHFIIARRNGIRVRFFDVGVGPTLIRKKIGETEFRLNALPLGGACIFDGMEYSEEEGEVKTLDEHAYPNAPVHARILTVLGGPMANFIVGYIFALIIVSFTLVDLPVVNAIMEDSAAMEAGLQAGDVITSIDNTAVHLYRDVTMKSMFNYGEPMQIKFLRNGEQKEVTLTPKYYEDEDRYYIGLLGSGEWYAPKGLEVFKYALYESGYWFKSTFATLKTMLNGHFSKDDLSGPVGVAKVVDDTYTEAKSYGLLTVFLSMLNLSTLLCINIGIVNLLPIPGLDGGKLLLLIVEVIRGKKVPPEKEGYINLVGFVFLAALMIYVMINDVTRLFM